MKARDSVILVIVLFAASIALHYFHLIEIPFYNLASDTKILIETREGFYEYVKYRAIYNPNSLWPLGVVLLIPVILYLIRKKQVKSNAMEAIFREFRMVHDEEVHDRKKKNSVPKTITHVPALDLSSIGEKSFFILKNVHPQCEKSVINYITGLLGKLKEKNIIPIEDGMCEPTGRPGEFRVMLMTDAFRKQKRLEDVLETAGLYFEETVGKHKVKKFPKITMMENDNLLIDTIGVNLSSTNIKTAMPILSTEFKTFHADRRIEFIFVTEPKPSVYEVHASKPAQMVLAKGKAIVENMELWEKDGPIKRLRDLWEKEKQFYWFFGQLRDSTFKINDNMIIVSGDSLIHPYLIGTSGSGKTEGLKTLLMTAKHAYGEDVEIYCGNGTPSMDLDPITQSYSPMGNEAAKPEGKDEQEKLVRLLNILNHCYEEANRRGALFKDTFNETGKECLKVSAYRQITGRRLPEIIIAIDEFAGYSIIGYEQNYNKIGSAAYILQVGMSQWRKYGIHFVIATQEVKAASIPRRLFTNMSGGIIFNILGGDKNYMESNLQFDFEGQTPSNFGKGEGIFTGGELRCSMTGASRIPVASPYIGKNIMEYIAHVGGVINPENKTDYDTDLLNLSDKDLDFSSISVKNLKTALIKCFLEREGWVVYKEEKPRHKLFNTWARYDSDAGSIQRGTKLVIAFADYEEVMASNWRERISRENPEEVDITIYIITAPVKPKHMDEMREKLMNSKGTLVLFKTDYVMNLREAYEFYTKKQSDPVFNLLLGSLEIQSKMKMEKDINEMYKGIPSSRKLHVDELTRIKEIDEPYKKGMEFENFYIALERDLGHDTIKGRELAYLKMIDLEFSNPQADGGLDVFRFSNREKKSGIGMQLKNMTSKAVGVEIVDKMVKTKALFETQGIVFDAFGLVTTGDITTQARSEGEALGFFMIDGERLDNIILRQDNAIYNEKQEAPAYVREENIAEDVMNKFKIGLSFSESMPRLSPIDKKAGSIFDFSSNETMVEKPIMEQLKSLIDLEVIKPLILPIQDSKVKSQKFKELVMGMLKDSSIDIETGLINFKSVKIACKIANSKPFRDSDYLKLKEKVELDVFVILIGGNSSEDHRSMVLD